MEVVQECNGLLKIEDILPFFPEFVTIDDFQVREMVHVVFSYLHDLQEALCTSLEQYNRDIETLKTEMDLATKSAASIRTDLSDLRNKFVSI